MRNDKVVSLLGFAVRSGKLVYGTDNIIAAGRRLYLVFIDADLSANSLKKLRVYCASRKIPLMTSDAGLGELLHRPGCKASALTDAQMAAAVLKFYNENYHLIDVEEN